MSVIHVGVKNLRKLGYNSLQEWMKDENNVYIGRACHYVSVGASEWSNPYTVKKYGREECIEMYREYVIKEKGDRIKELKGKVLGCWCKPEKCHGDVLIELLAKL